MLLLLLLPALEGGGGARERIGVMRGRPRARTADEEEMKRPAAVLVVRCRHCGLCLMFHPCTH